MQLVFGVILTGRRCGVWRGDRRTHRKPGGCWLWRRFMMGLPGGEAARIGDVSLQTVRDWALRFNEQGADGLIDGKAPGHASKLNDEQRRALKEIVEAGPIPAIHGVVRWRLIDLMQWLNDEFGVSLSETTMSREMRALGLRKLSARPRHHAQNELAVDAFKKTSPPRWRKSRRASIPA